MWTVAVVFPTPPLAEKGNSWNEGLSREKATGSNQIFREPGPATHRTDRLSEAYTLLCCAAGTMGFLPPFMAIL
jgi:hypothetical protein